MVGPSRSNGWLRLELRYLAALEAVAEESSFSAAANRLGYTQSAISQQVASLERIVGLRLIERPGGRRPVSLTDAGALLLEHAASIVARVEAARSDFDALGGRAGCIRIGTFQRVGSRLLPPLLGEYTRDWPEIEVRLAEHARDDSALLAMVERGDLDVAFAVLPARRGPFDAVELLRERYVLIVPAQHASVGSRKVTSLAELASLRLIGSGDARERELLGASLRGRGIQLVPSVRCDDYATVHGLVAEGVGAAVVPELSFDPADGRIETISLDETLVPTRTIGLVWHRERRLAPWIDSFVTAARALQS